MKQTAMGQVITVSGIQKQYSDIIILQINNGTYYPMAMHKLMCNLI